MWKGSTIDRNCLFTFESFSFVAAPESENVWSRETGRSKDLLIFCNWRIYLFCLESEDVGRKTGKDESESVGESRERKKTSEIKKPGNRPPRI